MANENRHFLTLDGLAYFYEMIKSVFVKRVPGKQLSTNDFTDELKTRYDQKLDNVISGDTSISVQDNNQIAVRISPVDGNGVQLKTATGEEGLFVNIAGGVTHKLTFGYNGEYIYDGSQDITVPVYSGTIRT